MSIEISVFSKQSHFISLDDLSRDLKQRDWDVIFYDGPFVTSKELEGNDVLTELIYVFGLMGGNVRAFASDIFKEVEKPDSPVATCEYMREKYHWDLEEDGLDDVDPEMAEKILDSRVTYFVRTAAGRREIDLRFQRDVAECIKRQVQGLLSYDLDVFEE